MTGAVVAGNYAALAIHTIDYKGSSAGSDVSLFDLRTGASVPGQREYISCGPASTCQASIDQLVLGSDAVSAAHTTAQGPYVNGAACNCKVEQIQATDSTGFHTLDSVTQPEGSPPALTSLTLTGDTLTWENSGSPRSAQLEP